MKTLGPKTVEKGVALAAIGAFLLLRVLRQSGVILYAPLLLTIAYLLWMMVTGGGGRSPSPPPRRPAELEFHRTLEPRPDYIPAFRWQKRAGTGGEERPATAASQRSAASSLNRSGTSFDVMGAEDVRVDVSFRSTASSVGGGGSVSRVAAARPGSAGSSALAHANMDGLRRRISSTSTSIASVRAHTEGGEGGGDLDTIGEDARGRGGRKLYQGRTAERIARIKANKAARDVQRRCASGSGEGRGGVESEEAWEEGREEGDAAGPQPSSLTSKRRGGGSGVADTAIQQGVRRPATVKPLIPFRDRLAHAASSMAVRDDVTEALDARVARRFGLAGQPHPLSDGGGTAGSPSSRGCGGVEGTPVRRGRVGGPSTVGRPTLDRVLTLDGSPAPVAGIGLGGVGIGGSYPGLGSGAVLISEEKLARRRRGEGGKVTSLTSPTPPSGGLTHAQLPGQVSVSPAGSTASVGGVGVGVGVGVGGSHVAPLLLPLGRPSRAELPGGVVTSSAPSLSPPSTARVAAAGGGAGVEELAALLLRLSLPPSYASLLSAGALSDVSLLRAVAARDPASLRCVLQEAGVDKVGHREALLLALQQEE